MVGDHPLFEQLADFVRRLEVHPADFAREPFGRVGIEYAGNGLRGAKSAVDADMHSVRRGLFEDERRFLFPEAVFEKLYEKVGFPVMHGGVLRRSRRGQRIFPPLHLSQHGVDETPRLALAEQSRRFHAFADDGVIGDIVDVEERVHPDMEQRVDHGRGALFDKFMQDIVVADELFERAEQKPLGHGGGILSPDPPRIGVLSPSINRRMNLPK